jgi:site-specific DNA-methyltransferase (adenine-specific)
MATENKMKKYELHLGSNLEVLPKLADCSVDAIVTDPPYELGFMGKSWDASGIAYNVGLWRECLRVLKPGGHILAFSGSRTYHRMTCAIEDAGFEIRDQMLWVYGSGFPKSHNISKALDKNEGHWRGRAGQLISTNGSMTAGNYERTALGEPITEAAKQWNGWGTALKPAHEPICLARKPIEGTVADNVLKWGTGGINIDACKVGGNNGRFPANLMHDGSQEVVGLFPANAGAAAPVKAGYDGTARNGIYHDYKQRGDDGATYYADKGSAARFFYCPKASKADRDEGCGELPTQEKPAHMRTANGTGEASMKSGWPATQRKNTHPTVKPTELMRYLCRLITPPGGTVLDPFTGSGSTGKAALMEGFSFVGIELSQDYLDIAKARIDAAANET